LKTKEKILNKALKLFNSNGLENVTTRHIATELGISQGNLHYHYPNKNTLIKLLFNHFINEIKDSEQFKDGSFKEQIFINSIKTNYIIMQNYSFLFTDKEIVWRRIPEIKQDFFEFFESKKDKFNQLLALYKTEGLIRKQISDTQLNFLANQFIFTITSWLSSSDNITEDKLDYFIEFTARLILPYLEKSELNKWESLLTQN